MITLRGEITRPGIYFFNSNDINVPLKDLLLYAGYKGGNIIVSPDRKNINIESKNVELTGSVRFPQRLNFTTEPKLSEIFPNANYVLPETYPLFAVIKEENKIGTLSFITFNPEAIYSGLTDIKLMNGDVIQFFKRWNSRHFDSQVKNDTFTQIRNLSGIETAGSVFNLANNSDNISDNDENVNLSIDNQKGDLLDLIKSLDKNTINTISKSTTFNDLVSEYEVDNNVIPKNGTVQTSEINSMLMKSKHLIIIIKRIKVIFWWRSFKEYNYFKTYKIVRKCCFSRLFSNWRYANINSIISTAGGYTSDADPERIEIQRIDLNKINNNTNFAEPGDIVFVHSSNIIKNNIKILGSIEVEDKLVLKKVYIWVILSMI